MVAPAEGVPTFFIDHVFEAKIFYLVGLAEELLYILRRFLNMVGSSSYLRVLLVIRSYIVKRTFKIDRNWL